MDVISLSTDCLSPQALSNAAASPAIKRSWGGFPTLRLVEVAMALLRFFFFFFFSFQTNTMQHRPAFHHSKH